MRTATITAVLALLVIPPALSSAPASGDDPDGSETPRIFVKMKGFKSNDGRALVQLYRQKKGFPTKPAQAWKRTGTKIEKKRASASFDRIPHGTYAVSVIHDEDGNGKLKTGFLGIPKEGVGVSNNASGMPTFKKARFVLKKDELTLTIKIKYL